MVCLAGFTSALDLAAPCGTEVVAIADGIVFAVDGPFGSPPHNLMIDHPQLGYASMYGHLFEAPNLTPGTTVKQGEVIALSGDSRETCYGRPHLHLEIRDLNHITKFNPMPLININWDSLMLISSSDRDFARDLEEPRKWQSLYDQPTARTAGPIINDFANVWPLDWEKGVDLPPLSATATATETVPVALQSSPFGRQITAGECCTDPFWASDNEIRFIDQPTANQPVGFYGIDLNSDSTEPQLVSEQFVTYSPDERYAVYPDPVSKRAVIEDTRFNIRRFINTQGERLTFTPDSQKVVWVIEEDTGPRETRLEVIWMADTNGRNAQAVFSGRRLGSISWLADDRWLISRSQPGTDALLLSTYSLTTSIETPLIELPRFRGMSLSPDKRFAVYYHAFQPNPADNGVWVYDLENPDLAPTQLPFFGTYRWRDNSSLVYVPFDPEAETQQFFEYNIVTKSTTQLFPDDFSVTISNNDWRLSPDGNRIVYVGANGTQLDGVWVLDIPVSRQPVAVGR